MPIIDFSLANPNISNYLEGKTVHPPVGEFMHVHTHFIQHNFLSEIEVMINRAAQVLDKSTSHNAQLDRLAKAAERLALKLNRVDKETAPDILLSLKEVYELCKKVLE